MEELFLKQTEFSSDEFKKNYAKFLKILTFHTMYRLLHKKPDPRLLCGVMMTVKIIPYLQRNENIQI